MGHMGEILLCYFVMGGAPSVSVRHLGLMQPKSSMRCLQKLLDNECLSDSDFRLKVIQML